MLESGVSILSGVSLYSCSESHMVKNKSHKGLPLETKNTQNHENRRLGWIESLHIQHCSMRGCIRPPVPALAVFDFQNN